MLSYLLLLVTEYSDRVSPDCVLKFPVSRVHSPSNLISVLFHVEKWYNLTEHCLIHIPGCVVHMLTVLTFILVKIMIGKC